MTHFSPNEIQYLNDQKLGRLATLAPDGAPNVVPVGFKYNPQLDTIDIGGFNLGNSKKFKNIQHDSRVSFVIDDVLPPWEPRGIEIRGTAETLGGSNDSNKEEQFGESLIRVRATHIISWGIDTHPYTRASRKIETSSNKLD